MKVIEIAQSHRVVAVGFFKLYFGSKEIMVRWD